MQALLAEHAAGVPALGHAVGPERDQVADGEQAFAIVVLAVGDHAEQRAADADLLGLALGGTHDHGRRVTGAGHAQQVAVVRRAAASRVPPCRTAPARVWARIVSLTTARMRPGEPS